MPEGAPRPSESTVSYPVARSAGEPPAAADGSWADPTGEVPVPPYVGGSTAVPPDAATTADGSPVRTEPVAGSLIARRYRLVRPLGEGGMGSVYLAEQTEPVRRRVALKLIKPGMDSVRVLARFEAERQALALMDHPNIARVLDAGTTENARPFFAMEVVDGPPITTYCAAHGLAVRERLALFVHVCRAVQHAHQKGVIHRDLKPSNILVGEADGRAIPKVIDFGLAKALGGEPLADWSLATAPGSVLGTPLYMAPEQAGGAPSGVDTRTDVYSLGVVLYELLTGTTPIRRERLDGLAPSELLRMVREEEPAKPSDRLRELQTAPRDPLTATLRPLSSHELDWITLKALEKDPARRYDGPGFLADDVARYLANEPVSAAPPSRWYRTRKFVRRHRGPVVAAGLVAAALVAGTVGTTVGFVREADQRREAEVLRGEAESQRDRAVIAEAVALQRLGEVTREKQRADEEAEIAREVNDFLGRDILLMADPRNQADRGFAADPNLTLRRALDRAATRIGDRFRNKPVVEAAVRRAIGEAYIGLGLPRPAIPHLERAAELLKTHRGPTHRDTLAVANSLGVAYREAGDLGRAGRQFAEALKLHEQAFGPTHHDTLIGRSNIAHTLLLEGRAAEAVKLYEAVVADARAKFGPDHEDTIIFATNLARALHDGGRTDEAIPLLEDCVARGRKTWPGGHPDLATILLSLGNAYREAGDPARAVPPLREAAGMEGVFPAGHPQRSQIDKWLGYCLYATGDASAAVPPLERTLAAALALRGDDHGDTIEARNLLALALKQSGDPAAAAKVLAPALPALRVLGPKEPLAVATLNNLADVYRANGNPAAAVPLFEEAARRAPAVFGESGATTLQILHNLAVAYRSAGDPEAARKTFLDRLAVARRAHPADSLRLAAELLRAGSDLLTVAGHADAEPVLRECVALYEKLEPDGWSGFHARSLLGAAVLGQRRFEAAEPLLAAGYEGLRARMGEIPRKEQKRLAEAADRLCELYTAWGKPAEAAKWRAERAKYGPEVAPGPRAKR